MKKLFYLACCLVLAMGVGCAIIDYDLITDEFGQTINTNGKARILSINIGFAWPDGMDSAFTMVDQKANGDRTLQTYNRFTTLVTGGTTSVDPPNYPDADIFTWGPWGPGNPGYCSPDWNGCSMITAQDPEVGDLFDWSFNRHCTAGLRSLVYVVGISRYYGECGRAQTSVADRIAFMNMGNIVSGNGFEGLLFNLNRNNFSMRLDNNAGVVSNLPMIGDVNMFYNPGQRTMTLDLTNSLLANTGRGLADFGRNYGTDRTNITFTLNGLSKSFNFGPMDADTITANMNRTY